jgi:serine/threonine protein kinase/tetratricopeptide (TPR) repeat protein
MKTVSEPPARDARVRLAVEEYLAACEAGSQPDRHEFLAQHLDIADVLAECLDGLDFIRLAAPGLRESVPVILEDTIQPEGALGDFRIVREIGRGGMGVVYEAVQISLGRRVALKVLPFSSTLDSKQLQRFKNEAQAAAHLHHQSIVPVYATGCERGVHYYAMQFIEGQTLAAVIAELRAQNERNCLGNEPAPAALSKEAGALLTFPWTPKDGPLPARAADGAVAPEVAVPPMPPTLVDTTPKAGISTERSTRSPAFFRAVAQLGVQAAEALEHAHQFAIIHRDIKPANLLVDSRGRLWVTDFGLAHCQSQTGLTMSGDLVGTLRYMSPEQALAKHGLIDQRTDIYSLGATLYELLTLEPAFRGRDQQELLRQIAFEEPQPLRRLNQAIPAELETIVLKALEKSPGDRYATSQELADDLERFLTDEPIRAKRPTLAGRVRKWARRHQPVVWSATVSAVVLLVLAVTILAVSNVWVTWERNEKDQALRDRSAALEESRTSARRARRAVDKMFTQVAEKWLSHRASMEPLQREFLEEALRFYTESAQEQETEPEARLEVALAYSRVAGIQSALGTEAGPEDASKRAVAMLEQLVAEFPSNAAYRSALAESYSRHGYLHSQLGHDREAVSALRRTVALLEELISEFPDLPDYRRQLAQNLNTLRIIFWRAEKFEDAVQCGRAALQLFEKLPADLASTADVRFDVCNTTYGLGCVLPRIGKVEEALEFNQRAIPLYEKLVDDFPDEPTYQVDLASCRTAWGAKVQHTKPRQAEEALRNAVAMQENVMVHYPTRDTVAAFHSLAARGYYGSVTDACYQNLTRFLMGNHRLHEAAKIYRQAIALYQKLVIKCPTVEFFWTRGLDYRKELIGLLQSMGQTEEVERVYHEAITFLEDHASELPESKYRQVLARSYQELGNFLRDGHRHQEAASAYRKSEDMTKRSKNR